MEQSIILTEDIDEIEVTPAQEQLEKEKRKRAECIQKLLRIQWVPVCTNIPLEGSETLKLIIPLKKKNNEEISVAAPLDCTTKDRIWFLSYKKRIVDGEVHTPELRRLFTWDDPFCIEDVAVQLKMLSQFFQIFRDDHHDSYYVLKILFLFCNTLFNLLLFNLFFTFIMIVLLLEFL